MSDSQLLTATQLIEQLEMTEKLGEIADRELLSSFWDKFVGSLLSSVFNTHLTCQQLFLLY